MASDYNDILDRFSERLVIAQAKARMTETDSYQAVLANRYRKYRFMYSNSIQDQWPEDLAKRPGRIHITSNIVKPAVDIDARLQAKLPRINLVPMDISEPERARAEAVEKMTTGWLEAADWEAKLHALCRVRSQLGKGVLKVAWRSDEKRPDFSVIELPENLRIGWGSSDYSVMDWALYSYRLSPQAVMERWPNVMVHPTRGTEALRIELTNTGDHADPLGQKPDYRPPTYQPSQYERKQVEIWDYWYKDREGTVQNCVILNGQEHAVPPTPHTELLDIPYVVIENDHEPGTPEGISSMAQLLDIQEELNRLLSHEMQLISDEIDPAYQLEGENNDSVPAGMVPKGGEIVAPGNGNRIAAIQKGINQFPVDQGYRHLWDQFHKTSGLGPIAFGIPSSSQESGQSLAIQADAYANRLDPRRTLLYAGLKEVLIFWTVMVERLNPKLTDPGNRRKKIGLGKIFDGFRRWKIIGPEITPKDLIAHTNNEINKMNGGVQSIRTTMDNLGIDSPEDELHIIGQENSNLAIKPDKVQQQLAVYAAAQQLQIAAAQLAQMASQLSPGSALTAAQDQTGRNNEQARLQQAQPNVGPEANQPATQTGSPPPGNNLQGTTLVRANPAGGQALNQLALNFGGNRQAGG